MSMDFWLSFDFLRAFLVVVIRSFVSIVSDFLRISFLFFFKFRSVKIRSIVVVIEAHSVNFISKGRVALFALI